MYKYIHTYAYLFTARALTSFFHLKGIFSYFFHRLQGKNLWGMLEEVMSCKKTSMSWSSKFALQDLPRSKSNSKEMVCFGPLGYIQLVPI